MDKTEKMALLGTLLVCVLAAAFCGMAVRNSDSLQNTALSMFNHPFNVANDAWRVRVETARMRGYMERLTVHIEDEDIRLVTETIVGAHTELTALLEQLSKVYLGSDKDIQELSVRLRALYEAQLMILEQAQKNHDTAQVRELFETLLIPLRKNVDEEAAIILNSSQKKIRAFASESQRLSYQTTYFSVVLFLLIVAVAISSQVLIRRRNRELRYRDRLFNQLSQNIDDVFLIYDAQKAHYELISDNTERILGIPRDVLATRKGFLSNYLLEEDVEELSAAVQAGKGLSVVREWSFTHPRSGEKRWIKVTVYPIRGASDARRYIIMLSDLTEAKRTQQALRDALLGAQKASAAKQDFLSRMSHEIRTPMNVIIGMGTIATANSGNTAKVEDCLDKILFASKHLLRLLNDVLDMSKIENGKLQLTHEVFNLPQLLHGITALIHPQAKEKGLLFEAALKGLTQEMLIGDPLRLNQILLNLLNNAVKFTPKGGSIRLEVQQLPVKNSLLRLRFTISDSGIGMEPAFMARIFQPFEQASSHVAQRFGGTGLGLSIVHNLVMLNRGFINVKSQPGAGSTFVVELNFGLPAEARAPQSSPELEDLNVLVVDDDKDCCEHASLLLQRIGVRGTWALSGEQAVDMVLAAHEAGEDFDVCFIDWQMPGVDGLETTRRIRKHLGPETLIIIISSYDWSSIEDEARQAGVNAFIPKPLFQSTIYDTLLSVSGKPVDRELPTPQGQMDFSGRRILLAEDNLLNREIALELLGSTGALVEAAENGCEALDLFAASEPGYYDAILMDVQMPHMDGHACTRAIRALSRPDAASVPIIAMTANAFSEDVSAALASGMNEHVSKPIDVKTLFSVLARYMRN